MDVLPSLSGELAAIIDAGGTSVVRVEAWRRLPASGIIWSSDGIVVTAHHVVERDENIGIGLPDGQTASAKLVGRDPTTDVAVLHVQATNLKPLAAAQPDGLRVGHWVLALGRPGRTVRAALGIVSALGDSWRTPAGGQVDRYLQADVTMYPGFSGGPLVDTTGKVLGLNTSWLLRGMNLTVPTPTLRRVVDTLLVHGRVRRGYLGIGTQPVRLPVALGQQLDQETGLLVFSLAPGSPAERGGLLLGDIIIALAGAPVRRLDDLMGLLSADRVGAAAPMRIIRGGQIQELTVVIGERT